MRTIHKYPRTQHVEGSRLQAGDEDLDSVPFRQLERRYLVVEEKLDGANAALSFDADGELYLQSRGHFLTGGPREKHFNRFKQWAHCHRQAFREVISSRYTVYGEWLYAKHTIFYDQLPHYFMEFDVLDTDTGSFLSTDARCNLLAELPIVSAPVLWRGLAEKLDDLIALVGRSLYKSPHWREQLAGAAGRDIERVRQETDPSELMEGLYIKVEEDGKVVERYKYVRASFLNSVVESGSHWLQRPIVPNQLRAGVDLFDAALRQGNQR